MLTKVLAELENYLQDQNIKNPKIKIGSSTITIDTIPVNFNLVADYLALMLCIYLTYTTDKDVELLIILWLLILIKTWRDFRFVSYVTIDLKEKKIRLVSKNPIQEIFTGISHYSFQEVDHFFDDKINLFNRAVPRYTINMRMKDGAAVKVTDFSKEKHAHSITAFLNSILENSTQ